jgi:hypothetical protein
MIKFIKENFSEEEVGGIFEKVLTKNQKEKVASIYIAALANMSTALHKLVKKKDQHHFIRALRKAGISKSDLNKLGYKCGKKLWKSCLDARERNLGGRQSIPSECIDEIKAHMESISTLASDKTVYTKSRCEQDPESKNPVANKTLEPARYVQISYIDAYKQYKMNTNGNKKVSINTFLRNVDKRLYKKPQRSTDLCDYCEMGKGIQKQVKSFVQKNCNFGDGFNFDIEQFLDHFQNELKDPQNKRLDSGSVNTMINKLKNLKSIEYHKSTATRQ